MVRVAALGIMLLGLPCAASLVNHLSTTRITTIPQLACLHFDSLCWLQVLPFVSICSEKSAHLTRLLAPLNKEVQSGHDALLRMLRTYAELAAPAGVQAASGMHNNGLQLRNVDLLLTRASLPPPAFLQVKEFYGGHHSHASLGATTGVIVCTIEKANIL